MNEEFLLNKWIWSEADFEEMGWHDCEIYAIAFSHKNNDFMLDIDYILKWIPPNAVETNFKFWVAPSTLVFENTYKLEMDIESLDSDIQIDNISRKNPQRPLNADYIKRELEWTWILALQQGLISLQAIGFKMYIRSMPQLIKQQTLGLDDRKGISFLRQRSF